MNSILQPLTEIADVISGYAFDSRWFGQGNQKIVRISDLVDGKVNLANAVTFDVLEHSVSDQFIATNGDVLVALSGATTGKIGIVDRNNQGVYVNQRVAIVRGKTEEAKSFLPYLLMSEVAKELVSTAGGAAQPNLSINDLKDMQIPSISSERQRQIAANLKSQLAEVETARQALEIQKTEIKTLALSALNKLFNCDQVVQLGQYAKVQSGYAFKSIDFTKQGIRLLRNANILPNKVYWDDAAYFPEESSEQYPDYVIEDGDVILSLDRPIISSGIKVARVSQKDLPALLVQRVGRFLIDQTMLDPGYLYYFLNTSYFIEAIKGHDQSLGVPHISPSQVENVEIPLPDINEQRKIAAMASEVFIEVNKSASAIEQAQKDIETLSERLLAQAFNQ